MRKNGAVAADVSHVQGGEEKEREHFRRWKQHIEDPKAGKLEHLWN